MEGHDPRIGCRATTHATRRRIPGNMGVVQGWFTSFLAGWRCQPSTSPAALQLSNPPVIHEVIHRVIHRKRAVIHI